MGQEKDDIELVERCKGGDDAAFEGLVRLYQDRIYSLCRYMLKNRHDAEDAAQDTFLKAYRNLSNFTPKAPFFTWLYRIAVNTCLDRQKRPLWQSLFKWSEKGEEEAIEIPSDKPSPEEICESHQLAAVLHAALNRLSPKLRAIIVLREIDGLSYEEIAEVLEVSVGTVKSRLSRAKEEMKQMMKFFREQK
jgi:RNA polymerase sigma-70 factor (ECF subfamily)